MAAGLLAAFTRAACDGAIAQLGERVVRNDEVGGSIPPGSTTLRPSGYAWRSRAEPEGQSVVSGEARRAKTDRLRSYSCFDRPLAKLRVLLRRFRHRRARLACQ